MSGSRFLFATFVAAGAAAGQEGVRPETPRLTFGGELSVALASRDKGYFNHTDYGHSLLRTARLDLLGALRLAPGLEAVADLRGENLDRPRVYAWLLRYRPFRDHELDVQAGRIPPVFGAFPRRRYAQDNPLVSWPLVWQSLTTLRPDAVPPSADALIAVRGTGWRVVYAGQAPAPGVPLAAAARWDTGLGARYANGPLQLAVALTQGSLSDPRVEDSNDGKQLSARIEWRPTPALTLGVSAAQGAFFEVNPGVPAGRHDQRAYGADGEFAAGSFLARAEALYTEWDIPRVGTPALDRPLAAWGGYLEARWRFAAGWHGAARLDRLGFGEVRGSAGLTPWEAPTRRLELGIGHSPTRHVLLKAVYQKNERDYGYVRSERFVACQATVWF